MPAAAISLHVQKFPSVLLRSIDRFPHAHVIRSRSALPVERVVEIEPEALPSQRGNPIHRWRLPRSPNARRSLLLVLAAAAALHRHTASSSPQIYVADRAHRDLYHTPLPRTSTPLVSPPYTSAKDGNDVRRAVAVHHRRRLPLLLDSCHRFISFSQAICAQIAPPRAWPAADAIPQSNNGTSPAAVELPYRPLSAPTARWETSYPPVYKFACRLPTAESTEAARTFHRCSPRAGPVEIRPLCRICGVFSAGHEVVRCVKRGTFSQESPCTHPILC
jgi:hypothetical protein